MTAYGRTALFVGAVGVEAGAVEAWAYTSGFRVFVPITWVTIEASIAAPILLLALGMLLGHFALPRIAGWWRWAVLALQAVSSAIAFPFYVPASAAFAGIVAGGLFFVAEDRRRRG